MMAGQYNEIVNIYQSEEVENEFGERVVHLKFQERTRAKVEFTGGSRSNENNEIVYDFTKNFYLRSYISINDGNIIEYESRKYRVITYDKRREYNDIKVVTELINE